jgi:hypothetical protein
VNAMPILIDELIVEAEPPRSPADTKGGDSHAPQARHPGQADRMIELAIVADRHYRIEVD